MSDVTSVRDNGDMFPVVVLSADGEVIAVTMTNEKGYKKSIENEELWHVVPETGRLLPFEIDEGFGFEGIKRKKGWIEVIYTPVAKLKEKEIKDKKLGEVSTHNVLDKIFPDIDILEKLARVVSERKKGKEGSYTSYLFNEGGEKIRKKLGEEVIELILASKRKDIVYEAADLFYHLLVLLESEDINLNDVFLELKSRMEKSK